jgi:phage FluMu protein Com
MKKNPQKNSDDKDLLLVTKIAQERAKKDLATFVKEHSYLFDNLREHYKNLEQFRKAFDFQGMSEKIALPLKQFSNIAEQIKALSQSFRITIPTGLLETLKNIENYREERTMVYIPRNERSIESAELNITKFIQKVEKRIEDGFSELYKAVDKNNGSDKMKIVNEKNVYCGHCDFLLMKVRFIVYGKASMKCPKCKKIIQIPEHLRYKELK